MSKREVKEEKLIVKKESNDRDDSQASDDEDVNWWEKDDLKIATRGEKRWDTLSHNGVMFPPEYKPHGIPIQYEGVEFKMTPEEEEVATMFAVMKESDYYRNETFRRNFFRSWRKILDKRAHPIRSLELCDFEAIYQWHQREREKKLSLTREEKKAIKLKTEEEVEPYRWCIWDGRREQVANFRVEPPGLFRGRGQHPMMGRLKKRVRPEDITINIDEFSPVPKPPEGHRWKEVVHEHNVTWLAMWRDNILENFKYVMLAPSSAIKGQSDMLKFERARELKKHIGNIRKTYMDDFQSRDTMVAQRAVVTYLIDKLALRVGNEKAADEADTVGCCSLRVEHIQLLPENRVKFDFLGKDSIRYENEAVVLPQVHALLARFIKGKKPSEDIFDTINPGILNEHFKSFMKDLSAKVFRTYNASITLDRWFSEKPVNSNASLSEKLVYFNKANTEVAVLCNHQKSVSKNHRKVMSQLSAKSDYARHMVTALERAKETMENDSLDAAVKEFFDTQDEIQYKWLEAYGTEEQKKEYDEIVASRGAVRPATTKSKSKSKTKSPAKKAAKKSSSKSTKKTATKTTKKAAAKKSTRKTKGKAKKEDSSEEEEENNGGNNEDDGVLLVDLMNPKKKKKTRAKVGQKRARKSKAAAAKTEDSSDEDEDEDEDDVPLSALQ